MSTNKQANRLIHEKSPYLLQHAYNPVDWYPWGEEAFEKAKQEDKPVFLSIGYSTCHWCHVMERESFEDPEVADLLNRYYVSIKVDREERPDVDAFYMDACLAFQGSGGWPLTCFLNHDRKPFFAGTYFPKQDRMYGIGFLSLLTQLYEGWTQNRDKLDRLAHSVSSKLGGREEKRAASPRTDRMAAAFAQLRQLYDEAYGGFGQAPKFPMPHKLLFLLRYAREYGQEKAWEMARHTLDCMYQGGIYDHIGGGFARYSTDRKWLVPHFEKMMTDNALHLMVYAEAAALFGPPYTHIAAEIAQFCHEDMGQEEGGYGTAVDADSEGGEGTFYLFTPRQVEEALGQEDGRRFCQLYHITPAGNFEGKSIPNLIDSPLPEADRDFARRCREKLRRYRSLRQPPFRDDKSLTQVNGLMIAALAVQGRMLKQQAPLDRARGCADFVLTRMNAHTRLLSRWRGGEAGIAATLDDYACLIWGLLELYQATLEPPWLIEAKALTEQANELFWDAQDGGYYLAGRDALELPVRQKVFYDGALPSGNSMMAYHLVRLARLTGEPRFQSQAEELFRLAQSALARPMDSSFLLCAQMYLKNGGTEVVLAKGTGFDALRDALPPWLPFGVVMACGEGYEGVYEVAPDLRNYSAPEGRAAAYVCAGGSCSQPVTSPKALEALLSQKR